MIKVYPQKNAVEKLTLLVFELSNTYFGIDISVVENVAKPTEIIGIPDQPAYIVGLIRFLWNIIPVINLEKRLGLPRSIDLRKKDYRILVVNYMGIACGLIVDQLLEITDIAGSLFNSSDFPPTDIPAHYISGTSRIDSRVIYILDLDEVFSSDIMSCLPTLITRFPSN